MIISGKAKLAGILGWRPVEHSRSPRLHGYWLEKYGIDGAYVPLPVRPEDFVETVRALARIPSFRGANVTVPHKETALTCCDVVSDAARRIGAVNTLLFHDDGTVEGRNTDGYGFLENLHQALPDWRADAGPAVVLGAGGAARAVVAALVDAGCPKVLVLNRTLEKAEKLAADIGGPVVAHPWNAAHASLDQHHAALLVNTTTLGMEGQPPLDLDLDLLPMEAVVTDIVYAPLETPLLHAADRRGNPNVDGLGMLLHQARPGFEAWFGVAPEVTEDLRHFVLNPE